MWKLILKILIYYEFVSECVLNGDVKCLFIGEIHKA